MDKKQTSLLLTLAKKLGKSASSKESAMKSLHSAGILTKKGKLAKSYPNLNRVITISK
jgi:predicted transcriptional regulator